MTFLYVTDYEIICPGLVFYSSSYLQFWYILKDVVFLCRKVYKDILGE